MKSFNFSADADNEMVATNALVTLEEVKEWVRRAIAGSLEEQ